MACIQRHNDSQDSSSSKCLCTEICAILHFVSETTILLYDVQLLLKVSGTAKHKIKIQSYTRCLQVLELLEILELYLFFIYTLDVLKLY